MKQTQTPNVENEEYTKYKLQVQKVDNVYNGSDTSEQYLERFVQEQDDAYEYRISNLTLLNFLKRTVNSSSNIINRKPLQIDGVVSLKEEEFLNKFSKEISTKVLKDGFTFIVVDSERALEGVTSRADEIELGLAPYMYSVDRKDVPNWSLNEEGLFAHCTILETYEESNGYIIETKEQQRVFRDNGTVEIWRDNELFDEIETGMNFVPVVKVGVEDNPYMLDLAKLNLNHMNRRSELNRYLRIAATPMPIFYGLESDTEVIIGVDVATHFRSKESGGFEWVEMSGQSTDLLQEDLKRLEQVMSETAVSLITSGGSQAKNSDQIQAEIAEDQSFLTSIAQHVEVGINTSLEILSLMGGYQALVLVNRDYASTELTPQQIESNLALYREGVISLDALIDILVEGEIVPKDVEKGAGLTEPEVAEVAEIIPAIEDK